MPLVDILKINSHTSLGIWQYGTERPEATYPHDICQKLQDKCASRKKEIAAVYALLRCMTNRSDLRIDHTDNGKPIVTGNGSQDANRYHIGISHTKGYACVILSTASEVAVDIEYVGSRIHKIASRFLAPDEMADITRHDNNTLSSANNSIEDTTRLLLYWCGKETIYKYYSDNRLTFQNMHINDIGTLKAKGAYTCKNLINNATKEIYYMHNARYVLTYCI